ncbi:hypothetical protein SAY87_007746 [Trapa incisa]|uniref:Uncharacterized protein n=1 Tax=Trapa incisa TaxID=236973 RepID=A0AAN7KEW8_9MYRT|nr:hypothetical protein SAY87_007746 [Trapa incisa]
MHTYFLKAIYKIDSLKDTEMNRYDICSESFLELSMLRWLKNLCCLDDNPPLSRLIESLPMCLSYLMLGIRKITKSSFITLLSCGQHSKDCREFASFVDTHLTHLELSNQMFDWVRSAAPHEIFFCLLRQLCRDPRSRNDKLWKWRGDAHKKEGGLKESRLKSSAKVPKRIALS